MASLSISSNFSILFLTIIFFFGTSSAGSTSSFSFPQFGKDPKFESHIAFYGDSKIINGGSAVQLTSAGRLVYKKPIKLVEGKPEKLVSFSTYFSFSLSQGDGNGLAFVMLPSDFDVSKFYNGSFGLIPTGLENGKFKIVTVKFSTLNYVKNDDLVKIHAGIEVGGLVSAKVRNASIIDLALNNGKKSHAWVDYEAGLKRLEVRLSQSGDVKPSDPLFWYPIDLSRIWDNEEALVGFFSSSTNSSSSFQACLIYSWSFVQRHVPQWMHSEPLDPKAFGENSEPMKVENRKDCFTKALASLVFGVACGALTAFTVLYLWTIFGSKRPVVPEEFVEKKPVDFEYEKVKVVVDSKTIEDGRQ